MHSKLRFVLVAVVWLVFASGCDAMTAVRQNLPVAPESGSILFMDDFSDPESGWRTWDEGEAIIAYHAGGLRFVINETRYDFWSRPGKWYNDVRLEVLVQMMNGSSDNDFGLICRYQDDSNFYSFLASSDGYAGILKMSDGVYEVVSGSSLEYRSEVSQGEALNHLRADCTGSHLALYVNDVLVAEAEDSDFTAGDVGLMAGTYDSPGVDILFDNFVALQP